MAPAPHAQPLREEEADPTPLGQFARWYREAEAADVAMPEAMALATSTPQGAPSVRMVLLKGFDADGFRFFSNADSRKGRELDANARAGLLFHWPALGRQVRIEGRVERLPRAETERYARSRPRGSQLSALASPQSEVVQDRAWLERRVEELERRHAGEPVPVHPSWTGYRLAPELYEFWQNRDDRLHDRLRYRPAGGGRWTLERLAP